MISCFWDMVQSPVASGRVFQQPPSWSSSAVSVLGTWYRPMLSLEATREDKWSQNVAITGATSNTVIWMLLSPVTTSNTVIWALLSPVITSNTVIWTLLSPGTASNTVIWTLLSPGDHLKHCDMDVTITGDHLKHRDMDVTITGDHLKHRWYRLGICFSTLSVHLEWTK